MILLDTSVWIDYLRGSADNIKHLLEADLVVCHPFVIGEIALGNLRDRQGALADLGGLPSLPVVDPARVIQLIHDYALHGRGLGYVDVCLVTSTLSTPGALLWTKDVRLLHAAESLGIAFNPESIEAGST